MHRRLNGGASLALMLVPVTIAAQDGATGSPPETIDILAPVPATQEIDPLAEERCEEEADAGRIAGEIVVCRQLGTPNDGGYNHEEFIRRYAEETKGPSTPDVAGAGIFRGPATVSGLCFIPPCPEEPAIFIDVEALPKAPAGSDADRIAKGLPPLGADGDEGRDPISEEELGLPEPLSKDP